MTNFFSRSALALALVALAAAAYPAPADAASRRDACEPAGEAGLDEDSLEATSSRPTLRGEISTARSVQIVIRPEGSEKVTYKSKVIRVRGDEWSLRVPKKLKDGEYDVEVYCPRAAKGKVVASGELVVEAEKEPYKKSAKKPKKKAEAAEAEAGTAVSVSAIPLLQGGSAGAGDSVPVSYLQVRNTGKGAVTISGFKVKQAGSAPTSAIESFTVVDGSGSSRVTSDASFDDGVAVAKADVSIPAGSFALFTIKANLADSLKSASGKSLKIEVAGALGAEAVSGKFPVKGTVWTLR
jgi:hypothetical protein